MCQPELRPARCEAEGGGRCGQASSLRATHRGPTDACRSWKIYTTCRGAVFHKYSPCCPTRFRSHTRPLAQRRRVPSAILTQGLSRSRPDLCQRWRRVELSNSDCLDQPLCPSRHRGGKVLVCGATSRWGRCNARSQEQEAVAGGRPGRSYLTTVDRLGERSEVASWSRASGRRGAAEATGRVGCRLVAYHFFARLLCKVMVCGPNILPPSLVSFLRSRAQRR